MEEEHSTTKHPSKEVMHGISAQEITAHEMLNMEWIIESRWLRYSYSTDAINSNNLVPNHVSEISIEDTVNPVASAIHSDK